tara:strand:+ start:14 stop:538 length:525 start_codon:yes stop_codon:yes gene_type:complete
MKLLMENWRRYIAEEETKGCVTVDQLLDKIDKMQKGEKDQEWRASVGDLAFELSKNLISYVPIIGNIVGASLSVAETFKKVKDKLRNKSKSIDYDDVADFPILGHLSIDPELIKVLEDDILIKLDEMYEDEVLIKLKGDTCIDKIPSINEFIRKKIAVETKKRVVIDDKSGTGI